MCWLAVFEPREREAKSMANQAVTGKSSPDFPAPEFPAHNLGKKKKRIYKKIRKVPKNNTEREGK